MAFREPADPLFGILSGHDGGNVAGSLNAMAASLLPRRAQGVSSGRSPEQARPLHAPEDCMCHALASALAFPRQRSSGGGCAT